MFVLTLALVALVLVVTVLVSLSRSLAAQRHLDALLAPYGPAVVAPVRAQEPRMTAVLARVRAEQAALARWRSQDAF